MGWITNVDQDDEAKKILWLTGPAGTGKTAIAGSIAEMCDELDLLAGSFFFASLAASESRRSKRCLVATLAYDLILPLDDDHPFRRAVIAAILRDPSVFCRRLRDQLRVVLVKPLLNTRHQFDAATLPKVFVLDGLDEVQALNSGKLDKHGARLANENDQEEILLALLSASNDPAFPFRIVVASRPERVIRNFFSAYANHATKEIFLDEKYDPDSDITLFLVARFAEIRRRYRLPLSWPSENDIQRLVNTASGQFIYAATVVRFLEGGSHPNPRDLLEAILTCRSQAQAVSALAPLDVLYTGIILSSPDPLLAFRWLIIIDADHNAPASFVNQLLQDFEGQADYLLENLTSLIRMPPAEDHSSPYELYHKCLVGFLLYQGLSDQELAETLESSLTFYLKCCTDVMIRKSPAVPLPEPQESDFIHQFLELDDRRNICYFTCHAPFNQQGPRALSECDVVWWVHRAILSQGTQRGERRISRWFEQVHKKCPFLNPGQCLPRCKHWRSNILRACKDLGWDTPNVIALFREALRRSIRPERLHGQSAPGWSFSQAFRSNGLEPKSDVYLASEAKGTLYMVDKDYQDVLKMVANMFSHLPAGWESHYMQELVRVGANVRNVFTAEIETIKCKLGIDALDSGASIEDSDIEEGAYQDWDVSKVWRSLGGVSGSEVALGA